MKLREDLNALTPRLRRYVRALMNGHPGGSDCADDIVHTALMRALGSRNHGTQADLAVRLYATVIQLHRDMTAHGEASVPANPPAAGSHGAAALPLAVRQSKLTAGLMSLALDEREVLLLVALENFDHGEASRILRISRSAFLTRLTRARMALESLLQTQPSRSPGERDRHPSHLRLVK